MEPDKTMKRFLDHHTNTKDTEVVSENLISQHELALEKGSQPFKKIIYKDNPKQVRARPLYHYNSALPNGFKFPLPRPVFTFENPRTDKHK